MKTIKEICKEYELKFPDQKIEGILDIGTAFVIQAKGKNGESLYNDPIMVNKEDGAFSVFFPPHHVKELVNAKKVDLSEIN